MSDNQTPTDTVPPFKRFKHSSSDTFGQVPKEAQAQKRLNFGTEIAKMTIFGASLDV